MKSKKRPLIGITANLMAENSGSCRTSPLSSLHLDYVDAVDKSKGAPLVLPPHCDENSIYRLIEVLDGLIISGGQDVNPLLYGEEPSPLLGTVSQERDEFELKAVRFAHELKKPILGICRGMQILNVAFGGSLHQDISLAQENPLCHWQKADKQIGTHTVEIAGKSRLHRLAKVKTCLTNSFHHQCIKKLAPGFKVNASAKDGIIEGIEMDSDMLILGVQWHPERMAASCPIMANLFKFFIDSSRKGMRLKKSG